MDPAARFTSRVADYIRYRPGYPREMIPALGAACGLTAYSVIADVGCGPGNLAVLFLENGNLVFGVEPNAAMRAAGEAALRRFGEKFRAVDGRAEATGLPPNSIDFVVAAQAFHWFEPEATRAEFRRILKPGGWVVLVWNDRRPASSAFADDYEAILARFGIDYRHARDTRASAAAITAFFNHAEIGRLTFRHSQSFDEEGLRGRLLSSSYAPPAGHPDHAPMLDELRAAFHRHQQNGRVVFDYETAVWYGRLPAPTAALQTPG